MKRILKFLLLFVVVVVASYNVYSQYYKGAVSETVLANIEALASNESGGSTWCSTEFDKSLCEIYEIGGKIFVTRYDYWIIQ